MSNYVNIIKRDKVCVGKKYKVKNLREGRTSSGIEYFAFDFLFYETENIDRNFYKRITLMSREKCFVSEGDWVELLEIYEYIVKRKYNNNGGISLFETLVCKFIKTQDNKELEGE